ncbi:MAG: ACT domain-containing protein [Candidatus Micrarchaeota archaeon]|nr:ACT domain-containing protein [Candidatus Micrarchaeota archaeon]
MGKNKQITLVVDDKVGVLADVACILGKARINIESISAVSMEGKAIITLFVSDEKRAAGLLRKYGFHILESEIIVLKLKDEPGELSKVSSALSEAGINIINLYIIAKERGFSIIAAKVDKPSAAKRLLKPYLDIEA